METLETVILSEKINRNLLNGIEEVESPWSEGGRRGGDRNEGFEVL